MVWNKKNPARPQPGFALARPPALPHPHNTCTETNHNTISGSSRTLASNPDSAAGAAKNNNSGRGHGRPWTPHPNSTPPCHAVPQCMRGGQ